MKPLHLAIIVAALGIGIGLGYSLYENESVAVTASQETPDMPEKTGQAAGLFLS